jgi:hypothetical protein
MLAGLLILNYLNAVSTLSVDQAICFVDFFKEFFNANTTNFLISSTNIYDRYVNTYSHAEKGRGILNRFNLAKFKSLHDVHLIKRFAEYQSLVVSTNFQTLSQLNVRLGNSIQHKGTIDVYGKLNSYCSFNPISKQIVFVFRGSGNLVDYALDSLALLKEPDGKFKNRISEGSLVHTGFWQRFQTYRSWVTKNLLDTINEVQKSHSEFDIIVVGHSLGAAWAFIQAADWVGEGIKIDAVYLYGMPKVGNQEFVDLQADLIGNDKISRVTNAKDGIPFAGLPGMEHPSLVTEIFFDIDATDPIICEKINGGDPKCSKKISCFDWDPKSHSEIGTMSFRKDLGYLIDYIPDKVYDLD